MTGTFKMEPRAELFNPTPHLRYRQLDAKSLTFVIEQMWQGSLGSQEWRPVPKVDRDGNPLPE